MDFLNVMRLKILIISILITAWTWIPVSAAAQADKGKEQNVLFLTSYENGHQWSDTILDGIKSVVAESGLNIDFHIEYKGWIYTQTRKNDRQPVQNPSLFVLFEASGLGWY